jgi:signal transduction histidine kinase
VHLRRTPVDVAAHLRDLAPVWDATAVDQTKRFSARVPGQPLIVSGDADRLQQVFSNLVGNALKYTPPGGTVTVTARDADAEVEVTVEDEGEGIPADRLPRIFDLFERATATGAGLGVGLAVVRALVEAHGGSVTASSPGVGRGSTFVVRLPLLRQPGP